MLSARYFSAIAVIYRHKRSVLNDFARQTAHKELFVDCHSRHVWRVRAQLYEVIKVAKRLDFIACFGWVAGAVDIFPYIVFRVCAICNLSYEHVCSSFYLQCLSDYLQLFLPFKLFAVIFPRISREPGNPLNSERIVCAYFVCTTH